MYDVVVNKKTSRSGIVSPDEFLVIIIQCLVTCSNLCLKTTRSKTEEHITNNGNKNWRLHISFNNVLNHKYTGQKQVYVKLNKAKMRIMQVNCLCEIYKKIFYLIHRCLNLFLGWLPMGLTPAFSTPAFSVAPYTLWIWNGFYGFRRIDAAEVSLSSTRWRAFTVRKDQTARWTWSPIDNIGSQPATQCTCFTVSVLFAVSYLRIYLMNR